ncbi:phage head-tail connector protein [Listeria booriae]|uniref:phage head-tail connector protein n=1 Tax=Listeria booriae TaxID=1552123 RepID=UPI0016247CF1|nr:phage head-tail connector protein [Listeria booriae]MBC1290628.1 phage head-tail connector protein [Listeria booriae]
MALNDGVLEAVKARLGIYDNLQDELLNQLIIDSTDQILSNINQDKSTSSSITVLPKDLIWILRDIVIKQFNRVGNEGMISSSEEGRSSTWEDDMLEKYEKYLKKYKVKPYGQGIARFL